LYIIYILWGIVGLSCYSVCFVAIFLSKKKPKEQVDNVKGMFSEKQAPIYEKTTKAGKNDRTYSEQRDMEDR
jgi:hypothetical protein